MFGCGSSEASRKYTLRMLIIAVIYIVTVVISVRALQQNPSTPWKYVLALLPMMPAIVVPMAVVSLLREIDELQKKIQLEALAFGFAGGAVLTLSYGFLQNAGLPQLSWIWVWPVMAGCWVAGMIGAHRRYR